MSHLKVCSTLWHFCSISGTRKIEKIQDTALRFVFCDHESPYKDLREMAGMSTLYVDRLRSAICEVCKTVNNTVS